MVMHFAELQFGHGGDAVGDASRPTGQCHRPSGFNSATAVTPWVTEQYGLVGCSDDRLQFGHGGDAVGDTRASCRGRRQRPCFNSATAVTPWVTPPPGSCLPARSGRFNSATAVTPWVTLDNELYRVFLEVLQFGHGGDAVGDAGRHLVRNLVDELQFGHGGDAVGDSTAKPSPSPNRSASIRPRR